MNGRTHWVRVKAFKGSESDSKGYWLTVWAHLSNHKTVTRDVKTPFWTGDDYEFDYTLDTPNANYAFTGVTIWLNDVEVVSETYATPRFTVTVIIQGPSPPVSGDAASGWPSSGP